MLILICWLIMQTLFMFVILIFYDMSIFISIKVWLYSEDVPLYVIVTFMLMVHSDRFCTLNLTQLDKKETAHNFCTERFPFSLFGIIIV